ncbi:hypothetical protein M3Y97_00176300 [Aphelenchoides bicaudatus]|nr:hypothetical protein M3Y97_00176300 [Aphelenchoides bicaudatus]
MASRRSKRVRRMQLAEEPVEQDNEVNADEDYVQPDESLPDDSKSVTSEAGTSSETLPETSSGTPAKMYYDYDPNVFQSVVRYRTHSDIVAKLSKRYPDQISKFQKMEGKIRILKYFYKSGESTPTSFLELLEKLENILGQKFPYNCSDVVKFPGKKLSALRISDVTLRRFYFILEFLKEEGVIVLIWRLSRYIAKKEADLGYQFAIDKKSVMKCLHALEQKQIVRLFKVGEPEPEAKPEKGVDDESMGGDGESSTQIPIVVPYSIDDPNDQRIKDAIIRVHEELSNEGRIFPTGQYSSTKQAAPTTTQPRQTRKRKKKIENDNVEQNLFTVEERYKYTRYSFDSVRKKSESEESIVSSVNGDNTDFDYGHQSKMIRCAVLHEFIYRVVHYMNRDSNTLSLYDRFPLNKYLPANTEPTPIESLPDLDDEPDSPYRHVVRIPPFKDAQRGWFMIRDVLQGMPLSIYVLLVKQQHAIDDLKEFLEDPERRHIPMADLPISMRKQLFTRQSALAIEHLCQLMSVMGLMRCSPPHGNKANVMGPHALFFCGKKAFFYDTSTSGRGYALVIPPIKQYKRYDYTFKTIENVLEYWNHLKAVCWSTSLGARHIPEGQENFKSDTRKYAQGNVDRAPFTADYDTEIDLISPSWNI